MNANAAPPVVLVADDEPQMLELVARHLRSLNWPKLEVIEEGSDTPIVVTPPKSGGNKVTEKKEGGRTTEVKVRRGRSAYTMKGANPLSVNERGNAAGGTLGSPQWQVMEFDLARKKKTDKEAVPAADAPPPPPPAK